MLVCSLQQIFDGQGEIFFERNLSELHVVDVGAYAVHTVARRNRDGIVYPRLAEHAVAQVYGLVAAVADEKIFRPDALQGRDLLTDLFLPGRRRIAVHAVLIRVLVGIQEDTQSSLVFVPRGRIGFQSGDVRPDET